MAPPRKHPTDTILDAARGLTLAGGPRAASVAAIAVASGAPVGTLYHRFGTRDGILAATWLRALTRFQELALAADAVHPDEPVQAGVAMARAAIAFARAQPEDARLLLVVRRDDLLDHAIDPALQPRLAAMNAPLEAAVRRIARALAGRADARALEAVTRAVVDVPTAAVRRHAGALPPWLEDDVADAAGRLLEAIARR